MRIEAFITDLLYDHDCVIVPGFGGLVANYRPARLNRMTHVVKPPSKHVGFNRNLTHHDGLLVSHVSRIAGISYPDALREVEEWVADGLQRLYQGERLTWERIGLFFRDRGGNLQFVPEDQENFLLDSFGLTAVQLRPVDGIAGLQSTTEQLALARAQRPSSSWWKAAAAVAVPLIAAGTFLYIGTRGAAANIEKARFNPFSWTTRGASYSLVADRVTPLAWDTVETAGWMELIDKPGARVNLLSGEEDARGVEMEGIRRDAGMPDLTAISASDSRFLIVAGAFGQAENARNYIARLQQEGYEAFDAGKRGSLHIVAAGSATTETAAREGIRAIKAKGLSSVWLLKR